jgi:hypothetical protein
MARIVLLGLLAAGAVLAAGCLGPSAAMTEDPARARELAARLADPGSLSAQELFDARMSAFTRALKESGHPLGGMVKLADGLGRLAERMEQGEITTLARFQAEGLKEAQAATQEEPPGAATFTLKGKAAEDFLAAVGAKPEPGVTRRRDTFLPGGQAAVRYEVAKAGAMKLQVAYFDRRRLADDVSTLEGLLTAKVLADAGKPVTAEQQATFGKLDAQLFAAARELVGTAAGQSASKEPDGQKLGAAVARLWAAEQGCRNGSPLGAEQRATLKAAQDAATRDYYTRMMGAAQAK